MSVRQPAVLYLHGFNSSPASLKARQFKEYCSSRQLADVQVPALSYDPAVAIRQLETLVEECAPVLLVGSSLGGFYATWLSERYDLKAALVNPAVAPCEHLGEEFLGRQVNLYTGEEYLFTAGHVSVLRELTVNRISKPENYLLLVQTGDEVLDYRLAVDFYAGCRQVVQPGGSHSFENFPGVFPEIVRFAGLDAENEADESQ